MVACFIVFIGIAVCLSGCSSTPIKDLYFDSIYNIMAVLDPANKTLIYTAQVQIKNNGQDSADELYFHLYGNLYKTDNESIKVLSVTDENNNVLKFSMMDKDQLICLALNDKLASGGETTVVFTCSVAIPVMESVYGVARDGEIRMSSFYPQLAVYDKNGWNTKPLAQYGDGRYLNTSDYMITIEAPSEYEIVCNGVEVSKKTKDNQTTYVFHANRHREILFIAYTDFFRMERTVGGTKILGYFNAERNQSDMENVMNAAAFSMEYYNRVYMAYPYETLVVTNGAWATKSLDVSMEYSGLFTVADMRGVDGANLVYHEMAHQWFYFLVGNNENDEPWLDEAFALFSATLCLESAGNADVSEAFWEVWQMEADLVQDKSVNLAYDDVEEHHWVFYSKGAIFLKELMDAIGKDEFLSIISDYCKTYAFETATTEDFLSILREQTPVDVEDIINKYVAN